MVYCLTLTLALVYSFVHVTTEFKQMVLYQEYYHVPLICTYPYRGTIDIEDTGMNAPGVSSRLDSTWFVQSLLWYQ